MSSLGISGGAWSQRVNKEQFQQFPMQATISPAIQTLFETRRLKINWISCLS
jgi:hypothetical protein